MTGASLRLGPGNKQFRNLYGELNDTEELNSKENKHQDFLNPYKNFQRQN